MIKGGIFLVIVTLLAIFIDRAPNATNVHIVVTYPKANLQSSLMTIRGNDCGLTWTKGSPLQEISTDKWAIDLTCPRGAIVQFKALEGDSNWMMGRNINFTMHTESPITVEVFPSFHPKINQITDSPAVQSKILNNTRLCSIYLPPSYFDNKYKQYPLLIMHDGQNLFEDSKSAFGAWKIQYTLNPLIGYGGMDYIIVVGVWNTPNRNNYYTYSYDKTEKFGGKGDLYLDFIEQELMPQINKWLSGRILAGNIGIGGSSLGGLISCYAAYTRPKIYNKAVCMSSSFWWNNYDFNSTVLKSKTGGSFYLDSGDSGPSQDSMNTTLRVRQKMYNMGYTINETLFYYLDKGGQHNEYYWGRRFKFPMMYLYG